MQFDVCEYRDPEEAACEEFAGDVCSWCRRPLCLYHVDREIRAPAPQQMYERVLCPDCAPGHVRDVEQVLQYEVRKGLIPDGKRMVVYCRPVVEQDLVAMRRTHPESAGSAAARGYMLKFDVDLPFRRDIPTRRFVPLISVGGSVLEARDLASDWGREDRLLVVQEGQQVVIEVRLRTEGEQWPLVARYEFSPTGPGGQSSASSPNAAPDSLLPPLQVITLVAWRGHDFA